MKKLDLDLMSCKNDALSELTVALALVPKAIAFAFVCHVSSRIHDHSGIAAVNALASRYTRLGKKLHLVDLSPKCCQLLDTAGDMVDIKIYEDLKDWHIATDKLA